MEKDYYISLIYKVLKGSIPVAQQTELDHWLLKSSENQDLAQEIKDLWTESASSQRNFDLNLDQEFAQLLLKMEVDEAKTISIKPASQRLRIIGIAAGFLLLCSVGFLLKDYFFGADKVGIVYTTSAGTETFQLPDGSIAWLREGSSLSLGQDFGQASREMTLKGEAFFEVETDSLKPFVVFTNDSRTQVLGTSFNLKAGEASTGTQVTVATGKVAFSNIIDSEKIILSANQKAIINPVNDQLKLETSDLLNELAWQRSYFQFEETSIKDIFSAFTKYFGTEITLENSTLLNCKLTGTYFINTGIQNLLLIFESSFNAQLELKDGRYIFKGGQCPE